MATRQIVTVSPLSPEIVEEINTFAAMHARVGALADECTLLMAERDLYRDALLQINKAAPTENPLSAIDHGHPQAGRMLNALGLWEGFGRWRVARIARRALAATRGVQS